MFTSRELNTFISVAEKMSIKQAAEELNVSSPAVCSMIKKLEGRVSNKLFTLKKNQMVLTQYGQKIYNLTVGHYHTLRSIEQIMRKNKDIIKIFISTELSFLSDYLINHFKQSSIEVVLTKLVDKTTDIIIEEFLNTHPPDYRAFVKRVDFYIVSSRGHGLEELFIQHDHYQIINKHILKNNSTEPDIYRHAQAKIIPAEQSSSIIDLLIYSSASAIMPHTCSFFKCLNNSSLGITAKRIGSKMPIYISALKKSDLTILGSIFDCYE